MFISFKINKILVPVLLFFFVAETAAQETAPFSQVVTRFDAYRNATLQEKIFVHTDKEFYLCGEILWFKLFYVDAYAHKPLSLSKVAYVELLNKEHQPVLQAKLALSENGSNGSFALPATISSGNYILRAYTNWMKNFSADYYFEKPITIINTLSTEPVTTKAIVETYHFNFFPEGGNLLVDAETKLAFQGVDGYGKGVDFKGVVTNQNGDTVASLQPLRFGIGSVSFLPKKGETYKAKFLLEDGSVIEKELPKVYERGYGMRLTKENDGKVQVTVRASADVGEQPVYLLIQSRNQVIATKEAGLKNGEAQFLIGNEQLPDGISQFTVFNAARQPVCERLSFKSPVHKLDIKASLGQSQYDSRKKVTLTLQAADEKKKPQPAALSVSVYQTDGNTTSGEDILSYLYLSSDLRGTVESPDYYFSDTNSAVEEAADNLMLTHGWRRFKWEEVLSQKKPSFSFLPEYEGPIITAKTIDRKTGLAAKGVEAYLALPDSNFQFHSAESNELGFANFRTRNFYGSHEIFAQAVDKNGSYRVDITNPFSESFSSRLLPRFSLAHLSGAYLQTSSVNVQVQQAYMAERMNHFKQPSLVPYSFYKPTQTYLLDDYTRFTTMEDVLREYVREVVVNKQNNKLVLSLMRKGPDGFVSKYKPLVLVDGVPLLDDYNKVFGLDPLKIKELQIVNKNYFLGTSFFEGIVNFRSYKGYPQGLVFDTAATVFDYEGLQLQREFYAPVYETQNQVNSRLPDFRNLLYWAPEIKTTTDGEQTLSFYTSDLPGKYIVVIQGLSANGLAGSTSLLFDVVNPSFASKN